MSSNTWLQVNFELSTALTCAEVMQKLKSYSFKSGAKNNAGFSDDNMTNEITCVVLDYCSFIVADPGGSSFNVTFICHATLLGMIAER